MKTRDEIKKALEFGKDNCLFVNGDCKDCAYEKECSTYDCDSMAELPRAMISDALSYIQHLEAERDQAVEDLRNLPKMITGNCPCCIHYNHGKGDTTCVVCGTKGMDCWQWRGVPEKEG